MYLDFFGLEREPFHITPDPEFLFPSPSHKEAFATVMYGVQQQKGFVVVTGEVGTGKTTVLRAYLQKLKGSDIQPIYLFDPHLEFDELLEAILTELGAPPDAGQTQFARLQWLRHYLIDAYSAGRSVVLIIDEAQNMPIGTLEQLRVLTNLETTKDKLLQVLLVGQPELEEKLALHQLRQLNQRVAVRATLRALGTEEATDYVKHRIRQAGGTPETVFTSAALKAIVSSAKGNPRVLNITCDNVLINAFGAQQSPVTPAIVRDVVRNLSPAPVRQASTPFAWQQYAPLAAAGVLLVAGGLVLMKMRPQAVPVSPTTAAPVAGVPAPATESAPVAATPEPVVEQTFDTNQLALKRMLERERAVDAAAGVAEPEKAATPETVEPAPVKAEPVVEVEKAVATEPVQPKAAEKPAEEPEPMPAPAAEQEVAAVPAPEKVAPAPKVEETKEAVAAVASEEVAKPEPVEQVADSEPAAKTELSNPKASEAEPVETVVAQAEPLVVDAAATPEPEKKTEPESATAQVESPQTETATPAKTEGGGVERVVEKGDKLIVLLEKMYGRSDAELIEKVQQANPGLTDPNRILAGEDLVFPELEEIAKPEAAGASTPAPVN